MAGVFWGEGTVALPMVGEFEGAGGTSAPSRVRAWERGCGPFTQYEQRAESRPSLHRRPQHHFSLKRTLALRLKTENTPGSPELGPEQALGYLVYTVGSSPQKLSIERDKDASFQPPDMKQFIERLPNEKLP